MSWRLDGHCPRCMCEAAAWKASHTWAAKMAKVRMIWNSWFRRPRSCGGAISLHTTLGLSRINQPGLTTACSQQTTPGHPPTAMLFTLRHSIWPKHRQAACAPKIIPHLLVALEFKSRLVSQRGQWDADSMAHLLYMGTETLANEICRRRHKLRLGTAATTLTGPHDRQSQDTARLCNRVTSGLTATPKKQRPMMSIS